MKLTLFHLSMITKALVCYAFAFPAIFKTEMIFEVVFENHEGGEYGLLMTSWFGKYILDFGTMILLAAIFVKNPQVQRKLALGVGITQLIGVGYCCSYFPRLDQTPLSKMRMIPYVNMPIGFILPIGYLSLFFMFLGVYLLHGRKKVKE